MLTSHLIRRIIYFKCFAYKCFTRESERLKTNHDNFCGRKKKKSLLFLAFFQLLSVLWTAQVGVYHSTLQTEPESFTMGGVA